MSKPIDFIDVKRVLNGYALLADGTITTDNNVIDLINNLKDGVEIDPSIVKIEVFTSRFAFAFFIKNGKVIASKQCEHLSFIDRNPVLPGIIDKENPYFLINKESYRKLDSDNMKRLTSLTKSDKAIVTTHKSISEVSNAAEFIFDTFRNEYLVFNVPILEPKKKPRYIDKNKEGYYVVYTDNDVVKMAFGNTVSIDNEFILYKGYDTFADADKRYQQFVKDISTIQ